MSPRVALAAKGLAGFAFLLLLTASPARAGIRITLSPPGAAHQQSPLQSEAGSRTETFDGLATGSLSGAGTLAVGTTSSSGISIVPADIYGGAGATGKYAQIADNPLNIFFPFAARYVGFWWSAASINDSIKLFDASNNLLGTLAVATISSLLGSQASPVNVTAIDGFIYSGSEYFNNPNPTITTPSNEPYAYVNLSLDDPGASFHGIEFMGSGFEFDNLTISPRDSNPSPTPAPGPAPLLGCAAALRWSRRLRRQQLAVPAASRLRTPSPGH